jgi:hypothetical protein
MVSSGILRRVALVRTDISEELSRSFIRVTRIDELGTTLAVTSNRRTLRRNTKIATGYRLNGRGITVGIPVRQDVFPLIFSFRQVLGPTQPLIRWLEASFACGKAEWT